MEHVQSRDMFVVRSKGALRILEYLRTDPGLRELQLDFQYGLLEGKTRAVARFKSLQGSKRPVIWVRASEGTDGHWRVSHSVAYA